MLTKIATMAVKQNNIKARNAFIIYSLPLYRKGLLSPAQLIYLGVGKPINTLLFLLDLYFSHECTASVACPVHMAKAQYHKTSKTQTPSLFLPIHSTEVLYRCTHMLCTHCRDVLHTEDTGNCRHIVLCIF